MYSKQLRVAAAYQDQRTFAGERRTNLDFDRLFVGSPNAVSNKFSNQRMPPLMAAATRSLVSGALLWTYARIKGQTVAFPKEQTRHALVIGLLFDLEFLFVYWGLTFTPASRSLIFLYTQAFWVALGAHFF